MNQQSMRTLSQLFSPEAAQPPAKDKSIQARVLVDMVPVITRLNPFKVGDLVDVVAAYSAYSFVPGTIAIVTTVWEPDIIANAKDDNRTPREDMLVAGVAYRNDGGACWQEVAVESWRFQKYDGPIA